MLFSVCEREKGREVQITHIKCVLELKQRKIKNIDEVIRPPQTTVIWVFFKNRRKKTNTFDSN